MGRFWGSGRVIWTFSFKWNGVTKHNFLGLFNLILTYAGMKDQNWPLQQWEIMKYLKQAGAELCQAQVKLGVIVYIGVKVEVEIAVDG